MAKQEKGEKKQPNVPARKRKVSSGASKRRAEKRAKYLAKRTVKTGGVPHDRAKRKAKREALDLANDYQRRLVLESERRERARAAKAKADEAAALGLEVPA